MFKVYYIEDVIESQTPILYGDAKNEKEMYKMYLKLIESFEKEYDPNDDSESEDNYRVMIVKNGVIQDEVKFETDCKSCIVRDLYPWDDREKYLIN